MAADATFGPLIDEDTIERAVIAHLKRWWPTYKLWWEGQKSTSLEPVASWVTANEVDAYYPEDHLPCVVVACPGLQSEPVKNGDGTVDIAVQITVGAVVSNRSREDTRRSAHWYGALLRLAMLQQAVYPLDDEGDVDTTEEPLLDSVEWVHAEPQAQREKDRTLLAKAEVFTAYVPGVLDVDAGPNLPEPDTDHDAPYTAGTVTVDVEDEA